MKCFLYRTLLLINNISENELVELFFVVVMTLDFCMNTQGEKLTLNSLGTMSLGVSTPTSMSTPQKMRMARMMAKSLMSFRTWVKVNTKTSCNLPQHLET